MLGQSFVALEMEWDKVTWIRNKGAKSSVELKDQQQQETEREEELKNLLTRVKEESKMAGLKLNIKKLIPCHLLPSHHSK